MSGFGDTMTVPALFTSVDISPLAPYTHNPAALRKALAARQGWNSRYRNAGLIRYRCGYDVEMSHIYGDKPIPRAEGAAFVAAVTAAPAWAAVAAAAATTEEGRTLLALVEDWTPGKKLLRRADRRAADRIAGSLPDCALCRGEGGNAAMALAGALLRDTSRLRAGLNPLKWYGKEKYVVFPT